jgi:cell division transport system permease protein
MMIQAVLARSQKATDIIRNKRYDLPLHRGSGGKLVTWIVGVMTYLCILSMVIIFGLNTLQHYWQQGLTGKMTIEIPHDVTKGLSPLAIQSLVNELNLLPGIKAERLTQEDIAELVGPWLGDGARLAELPLPTLIDVQKSDEETSSSNEKIEEKIHTFIPSATLDTHQEWLADLLKLAKACRMLLIGIAVVLALTTALTVAATARTRLALHKEEVDLLHLIGATDSYIATQFQRQAFRLATEGAAAGLVMALISLLIVGLIRKQMGGTLLPALHLSWFEWVCLLLTPLLAGAIAMIASRFTVLRALKDMP